MLKPLLVIALVQSSLPLLRAAEFHVATTGDDLKGTGTADQPWHTIQKACNALKPGDSIFIHKGTYAQRMDIKVSGTAAQPLMITGEAGTILSGKGLRRGNASMIAIEDQSHITIASLEICGTKDSEETHGIRIDGACSGITIKECHLHHLLGKEATAIGVYGTDPDKAISGVVIDDCHIHDCEPAGSEALVINGNVDGFVISNNHIHDVNNIGIDMIGGEKSIMPAFLRAAPW